MEVRSPLVVPPLVGAAIQIVLGILLLVWQGDRRAHRWFAVQCAAAATWSSATALAIGAHTSATVLFSARLSFTAILVAAGASLAVSLAWARRPLGWAWALLAAAAATVAAIWLVPSLMVVAPHDTGGFWAMLSPAVLLVAGLAGTAMLAGIWQLVRARDLQPPSIRRRQLGWALASMILGCLGGFDALGIINKVFAIGWLTSTLACLAHAYSLMQPRLLSLGTLARRVSLAGGAAGVGAVLFAALFRYSPPGSLPILVLGLLVLFGSARLWVSGIEPIVDRLLEVRRGRVERALARFEEEALAAHTRAEVEAALAEAIHVGFDARVLALYTPDRYREVGLLDDAELLARLGRPVLRDLVDLDDAVGAALHDLLGRLGADALLPLSADRSSVVALVAVAGPGLSEADDVVAEDLARLSALGARAWVSARMYEEIARRSAGLEAEVRMRTAELEEAVSDLRFAQSRVVEAERSSSVGLLVAGVSHEINNALNFISANLPTLRRYVEVCDRGLGDAPVVADARRRAPASVDALAAAVKATSTIVADLRRFARPDAERRWFRLDEGLETAVELVKHRAKGRVDLGLVIEGNLHVDGHPGPLHQALLNLIVNAIEAASSSVWVTAREEANATTPFIELTVSDDGQGIPAGLEQHIFEPFFTTRPKATGLGLTVARQILERHHGTIEVVPSAGHGAMFRVRLPTGRTSDDKPR